MVLLVLLSLCFIRLSVNRVSLILVVASKLNYGVVGAHCLNDGLYEIVRVLYNLNFLVRFVLLSLVSPLAV